MGCGVSKASAQPYRTVEIGHFRVNKILGKGSFGKVCVIERLADGHLFALKYSDKEKALRDKAIPYIVQERNMLEEFRHTLICGLRYSFQDEKFMYMILDMMSGGDLRFHIKSRLWNQDETTFVIAEISCALGYLHSHKIVHRDIKPDNILLDADGHAHLSDFNVAIRYVEGKPLRSVAGTEPYMAPEIIIGTGYTMAVDWWSLGVTMFEMVCGERPFRTKLRRKLIRKAKYKFPEPLVGNGTLSELCKSVITAMLQLDPKKRLGNRLNGASTLQNHPLFMNLDWNHINTKTAKPVFVPSMTTSNFKTDATTDDLIDFINQKRRTFQENDVSNSLFRGFSYFDYTLNSTESHEAQTLSFSNKSDPVDFNEYEYTDRVNTTFDTTDSSGINRLQSFLSQLSTKQKVGRSVLSSLGVGGLTQRHSNRSYQMPLEDQPRSILQITASASTAHQISVGCTGPSHVVHLSPLAKSISTGSSLIADNAYNQEPEHPIDNIHDVHDCSVQYHSHPLAHLSCPKEPLDMNYSFAGEGETPAQLCASPLPTSPLVPNFTPTRARSRSLAHPTSMPHPIITSTDPTAEIHGVDPLVAESISRINMGLTSTPYPIRDLDQPIHILHETPSHGNSDVVLQPFEPQCTTKSGIGANTHALTPTTGTIDNKLMAERESNQHHFTPNLSGSMNANSGALEYDMMVPFDRSMVAHVALDSLSENA
ncbi:hypothetical protein BASA50_006827 [Batrachochytrium salamandrivorans]|uniref:Protein kinase domain-containing protein n=1 Tax=Batrachochytrium salamandrivorans TaxID=1357716 RepID=A0ABQ8F8M7_9FUNG|nr:hypothetical protein BASA62_008073 [Batrachochytrium salamandrivorans]KAH6574811.1 hypothetical protein BASA60_005280 [Batrachochytrium salamandrivorans]KAH6594130.1 hypothetical protein BASA50_006827 [Batrachochytrium salamandrivorans]KAH6601707.1 hypothetical protein BASA61_001911 [Batrachochytrium salamandrivorans]KAH9273066.1 hypothetical protein BASA83_004643 [Batrachochytrium salamandrivorans]